MFSGKLKIGSNLVCKTVLSVKALKIDVNLNKKSISIFFSGKVSEARSASNFSEFLQKSSLLKCQSSHEKFTSKVQLHFSHTKIFRTEISPTLYFFFNFSRLSLQFLLIIYLFVLFAVALPFAIHKQIKQLLPSESTKSTELNHKAIICWQAAEVTGEQVCHEFLGSTELCRMAECSLPNKKRKRKQFRSHARFLFYFVFVHTASVATVKIRGNCLEIVGKCWKSFLAYWKVAESKLCGAGRGFPIQSFTTLLSDLTIRF